MYAYIIEVQYLTQAHLMPKCNYEPYTNCTYLIPPSRCHYEHLHFVFLLKNFYYYHFIHNVVIGHCIGHKRSIVSQMDIFNTYLAHIRYLMTFQWDGIYLYIWMVTPGNINKTVMYTYCCNGNTRPPIRRSAPRNKTAHCTHFKE